MAGENFALGISFKGNAQNFIGAAAKAEAAAASFGRAAIGAASRVNGAFLSLGNSWLSQVTSITGGIAGLAALKGMIDAEYRMTTFGINAGIAGASLAELRHEISAAAMATSMSAGELTDGLEIMLKKTGNITLAREQLKLLGTVATATGAETKEVGLLASDMLTQMHIPAKDLLNTFDALAAQGKMGGFYVKDFAAHSSELMQAASAFGVTGTDGLRRFNALLQISGRGKSDPADIANAFAMALAVIKEKSADLREVDGISLYNEKKGAAGKRRVLRDVDDIIKDIIVRSKGDPIPLEKFFGNRAVKAILPLAESYRQYGDWRELDRLNRVAGDGTEILRAFNTVQGTTKDQLDDIGRLAGKIAKENMAMPFQALKGALDLLQAHPVIAKGGIYALLGIGGAVGASVIANRVKDVFGGAFGGAPGGNPGVQKVFVTNAAGIGAPHIPSAGDGGYLGTPPRAAMTMSGQNLAAGFFSVFVAASIGYEIGAAINDAMDAHRINPGAGLYKTLNPGAAAEKEKLDAVERALHAANADKNKSGAAAIIEKMNRYTALPKYERVKRIAALDGAVETAGNVSRGMAHGPAVPAGWLPPITAAAPAPARVPRIWDTATQKLVPFQSPSSPAVPAPDVHNRITIAVHVDKDGKGRVITEGKNTTTRIHNPGSFG